MAGRRLRPPAPHDAGGTPGGSDIPVRRFRDRFEAGRALTARLEPFAGDERAVVLGLPRGGVPVAFEVARLLGKPLDVFLVRKLGVPGHRELAMGAIASGGVRVLNPTVVDRLRLTDADVEAVAEAEARVLAERERAYRGARPPLSLAGATAIVVDDGLATGASMRAAVTAVRAHRPAAVVVAVPVAAAETCAALGGVADDVVCALTPDDFVAVGLWYDDFSQTTDDEVRDLLVRAAAGG